MCDGYMADGVWCLVVYGCTRYVARRGGEVVGSGGVGWCTVCVVPGWGLFILDTECLFSFE